MKTTIAREYQFSAGHILPNHAGKCSRLHGHNYKVEVSVSGRPESQPGLSSEGMVLDFGDLDRIVKPIIDTLDHRFLTAGDELPYKLIMTLKEHPDLRDLLEGFLDFIAIDRAANSWFAIIGTRTTAENIAAYIWQLVMASPELKNFEVGVRVWETDKSTATFPEI